MPAAAHQIDIVGPDNVPRRVEITGTVDLGRSEGDHLVDDPSVSRRHLRLDGSAAQLVIEDLGSSYGTSVNGQVITGPTGVSPGDRITLGNTSIVVVSATPPPTEPDRAAPPDTTASDATTAAHTARPRGDFSAITEAGVEVRWAPRSAAAAFAPNYARRAARARTDLSGLGSEAWGTPAIIYLVDPFPDPANPSVLIVDGAVVDAENNEIWIPATPESPPEDPHRSLGLMFGAALPSAADIEYLIEGYALHVSAIESPDAALAGLPLPPVASAEGELRAAMSLSFVRYLIAREDKAAFTRLLATAPGRVEQSFQEIYGQSSTALENGWQQKLQGAGAEVKPAAFLRLSAHYLRPYWRRQIELFVYMLLSLAFVAAFPFISRRLLDTAIPSGEMSQVFELITILGAAFMVSLVAGLRENYLAAWISGAVVRDIRLEVFDRIQRLPTGWFHRHQQGEVLQRLFGDVQTVETGLSEVINTGISQTLTLAMSAVIMMTLNPFLGIIVLAATPLVAIVYRKMADGALKRSMTVQEENGALFSIAAENYTANSVVKAFQLAGRERGRFARGSERVFVAERKLSLFSGLFGLSVNTIVTLLRLAVFGLAGWLIIEGRFTIGGLLAFMTIMGEVLNPVTSLTGMGQALQTAMGALVRVNEVLDTPPEGVDDEERASLPTLSDRIELRDVIFSYTPEIRALDGVSATIEAGTRVAFVGPSGSGKSTVLRMLMRMYEPDSGAVLIDGVSLASASLESLRSQSAVVFQESFLFDATIRENIALGHPSATEPDIAQAARDAGIDDFIDQLPRGLDSLVGEGGGAMSGGQRQRVSIARALIARPSLLLLDEATSALDARTERQINETLSAVAAGRTVVAVTHRLASIIDYDRIFVMDEGKLVEQGSHDELVALGGLYARLWAEQAGLPAPKDTSFDAVEALGRISFFRDLSADECGELAHNLRASILEPGDVVTSSGAELMIVRSGRGELVLPGVGAADVITGLLGPGDAFGVNALLDDGPGPRLRAVEEMTMLVLDDDTLRAAAARHPSVAAHLEGQAPASGKPLAGRHLTRATFAGTATAPDGFGPAPAPEVDLRRRTGTFTTGTFNPGRTRDPRN